MNLSKEDSELDRKIKEMRDHITELQAENSRLKSKLLNTVPINMSKEERRLKVIEFFKQDDLGAHESLNEALYTISELRLWPDSVDSVSEEQAIFVWKIVEKLKSTPFPSTLIM